MFQIEMWHHSLVSQAHLYGPEDSFGVHRSETNDLDFTNLREEMMVLLTVYVTAWRVQVGQTYIREGGFPWGHQHLD